MAETNMDSTPDTLAHRQMVVDYATDFCSRLMDMAEKNGSVLADYAADFCDDTMKRAERHDESKLHAPEKERFDYVGTHQHLGKCKYGSDEYKKSLEYLGPALQHHYEVNDHHPEHFENGVDGMNLMQLVELFCDWDAACHRNKDGNIYQSLEKNKERFTLAEDLYSILKTTADIFEGKTENVSETDMDLCGLVLVWLDCLAGHGGKTDAGLYEELVTISGSHKFSDQINHIVLNTATALDPSTKE